MVCLPVWAEASEAASRTLLGGAEGAILVSSTPIVPNVIEDDGRAISTPSATEVPVELRPTSENELNMGTTFEGADRRTSSTRREHGRTVVCAGCWGIGLNTHFKKFFWKFDPL